MNLSKIQSKYQSEKCKKCSMDSPSDLVDFPTVIMSTRDFKDFILILYKIMSFIRRTSSYGVENAPNGFSNLKNDFLTTKMLRSIY